MQSNGDAGDAEDDEDTEADEDDEEKVEQSMKGKKRTRSSKHTKSSSQSPEINEYNITLPSTFSKTVVQHPAMQAAVEIELTLRKAQADKALDEVRTHVATSYGYHQHAKKATSQQTKTRSHGALHRQRAVMKAAANVYRRARRAMVILGLSKDDTTYKKLRNDDMRPFAIFEKDRRLGDSKDTQKTSWIWRDLGYIDDIKSANVKEYMVESESFFWYEGVSRLRQDSLDLRVHWFRTEATAVRWSEELLLVKEEMARTMHFFDFYARLWTSRAKQHDEQELRGQAAYARR